MKPKLNLKNYIEKEFKNISDIDYVNLFLNNKFEGKFAASLALGGKYLALDLIKKRRANKSYCFPISFIVNQDENTLDFDYCGANFELSFFKSLNEKKGSE